MLGLQADAAQERHAQLRGRLLAAAFAEHLAGHVLDDAHHRHFQPLEGGDPARGIGQGDRLRRGDDDAAGQRHQLRQAELRVARARRQVHDQVVEFGSSATSVNSWRIALCSIGPRQTSASPSGTRKPMDMTSTPYATAGDHLLALHAAACSLTPIIIGTFGP